LLASFKAYDGLNNTFNFAYEVLSWKVHRALIKAKLEPYLGFLHTVQFGKPSLVCDFMELYRYQIDGFLLRFCQDLKERDFTVKFESVSRKRKGKREYLNRDKSKKLMDGLYGLFESKVDVPRLKHGNRQTVETLIFEEAWLLAKFLRGEQKDWNPRITVPA
jgi:CRISPR-associated protein Cas1